MSISNNFEFFLFTFLKNRTEFISENKEIFQVLVKELVYKEELKAELIPYFSEVVTLRLTKVVEFFKERGELIDIPAERILKILFTFVGGFLASRFVFLSMESISDEEIEDAVHFIMNGIRRSS